MCWDDVSEMWLPDSDVLIQLFSDGQYWRLVANRIQVIEFMRNFRLSLDELI